MGGISSCKQLSGSSPGCPPELSGALRMLSGTLQIFPELSGAVRKLSRSSPELSGGSPEALLRLSLIHI
eukprot:13822283-Alexandrium_andersonii.AAC.1